ncbi:hypothetical protein [Phenylobacterium sp.]|uniref:hypothetical protein n=1 Tax=Phenylobacterium sp. TaxID=1871053 RepID=UPI00286B15EB|nr:hypothetical protein [Phenylobacterium sp.]
MNPEFQRNLWLEAAPRRIAWAAVTLVLIYGAALMLSRDIPYGVSGVGDLGVVVFSVCAMVWGARAAGASVLTEISDRTWDYQRLSALDPWAMTWGKLFGRTSLAWLCALSGLLVQTISSVIVGKPALIVLFVFLISLAILLQAISMGGALIGVRKARAEGRVARAGGVLGGLLVGAILLSWVAGSAGFQRGQGFEGLSTALGAGSNPIDWGGAYWTSTTFRALAVSLFAAWAVVGVWRLMRLELQMRNSPWVWVGFLIFLAVFAGGFMLRQGGMTGALVSGVLAVALCAYAAAFAEPADRVRMRQFHRHARAGDFARAAPLAPSPLAPFILGVVLTIAAFASSLGGYIRPEVAQAAALMAFLLRDLGVIAICRLGDRPQRGDFAAVVALGLLYGVGGIIGWSVNHQTGAALFAPLGSAPLMSLVSGLVQAGIAWALVVRRIGPSAPPSAPASVPAS